MQEHGKTSAEALRQAKEDLFGIQNSRKARIGGLGGLNDPMFMKSKQDAEDALKKRIAADPARKAKYYDAWEKVAEAQKTSASILKPYNFLERGLAFDSNLFGIARTIVRMAEEGTKPNGDRLREYRDSARSSLEQALFSTAPIYPDFEKAKLAHALGFWKKMMPGDPMVERIMQGRDPQAVAKELVDGSKLADVDARKAMVAGGSQAIAQSQDPMIKLALTIDADARALRKTREDKVEGGRSRPVCPDRQGAV